MGRAYSGGIWLYYEAAGEGEPILLVNGSGASSLSWEPEFIQSLASSYRVLTFDNRGTGRSGKPRAAYSIPEMALDCLAILGVEGITRAHIVGASMGGRIALELALTYPETVKSLVLCCTDCGGRQLKPSPIRLGRYLRVFLSGIAGSKLNRDALEFFFTKEFVRQNRDRLEAHWRRVSECPTPMDSYRKQLEAVLAHSVCGRLQHVAAPTLVLGGDRDLLNPVENLQELAAEISKAELYVYPGLGHGFMFEAREDVTSRILAFLNNVSKPIIGGCCPRS